MIFFRFYLTKAEFLALTPKDFDFEKNTLDITKSLQRVKKQDVVTRDTAPRPIAAAGCARGRPCGIFELTLPQIRDLSKAVPAEAIFYGRLPLMVTENCLIRGRTGRCDCRSGATRLMDRKGEEFPVIRDCGTCRSVVLNGKKLYWTSVHLQPADSCSCK